MLLVPPVLSCCFDSSQNVCRLKKVYGYERNDDSWLLWNCNIFFMLHWIWLLFLYHVRQHLLALFLFLHHCHFDKLQYIHFAWWLKWLSAAHTEELRAACPKIHGSCFEFYKWIISPPQIKHLLCFPDLTPDKTFPFISLSIFIPLYCNILLQAHWQDVCISICECGCLCFLDEVWCH